MGSNLPRVSQDGASARTSISHLKALVSLSQKAPQIPGARPGQALSRGQGYMDSLPAEKKKKKQQAAACDVDSRCFFHLERGEVKRRRKEVVMLRLMSATGSDAEDLDQPASAPNTLSFCHVTEAASGQKALLVCAFP